MYKANCSFFLPTLTTITSQREKSPDRTSYLLLEADEDLAFANIPLRTSLYFQVQSLQKSSPHKTIFKKKQREIIGKKKY